MDFSILSDDQLIQLLKTAMMEAIKRGGAVRAAADAELVSASDRAAIEFEIAEKFRLEKEKAERERIARDAEARIKTQEKREQAAKVESTWGIKAAAVAAIRLWGYEGEFDINIWSNGADRRVYLQSDSSRRPNWKWCLYLTGNQWHPPGELTGEGADCFFDDKQEALSAFLKAVADSWKSDVKIPSTASLVNPDSHRLAEYLVAIGIKETISISRVETAH